MQAAVIQDGKIPHEVQFAKGKPTASLTLRKQKLLLPS